LKGCEKVDVKTPEALETNKVDMTGAEVMAKGTIETDIPLGLETPLIRVVLAEQ